MASSSREKALILLLPSMVVLIVYAIFFSIPHFRAQAALEKNVQSAEAAVPGHDQVHAKQHQVANLRKEVDRRGKDEKALAKAWDDLAGASLNPATRSDRLTRLLTLLATHHLHVMDHAPIDGSAIDAKDLKLSASQERLLKLMSEPGKQPPQARRLHLAGKYGDVVRALQALSSGATIAIPMGVVMKEASPGMAVHEWWVYLWI